MCRFFVGDPADSPMLWSAELFAVYAHVNRLLTHVWQGFRPLH
jgi:hypothetical protein